MLRSLPNVLKSMNKLTEISLGEFSSLCPGVLLKPSNAHQEDLFAMQVYLLNNYYETNGQSIFNLQRKEIRDNQRVIFKAFLEKIFLDIVKNKEANNFKEIDFDAELMNFFDFWWITQERNFFESGVAQSNEGNDEDCRLEVDKI